MTEYEDSPQGLRTERDDLLERVSELEKWKASAQDRIEELLSELATSEKELRRRDNTIAELNAQVEELSVSPLDLPQQQRVRALSAAREVVEEVGSAGVFTKAASSKVSIAGVLSTAHFIVSGERDYITADGEYLLDPTRRVVPALGGGEEL